MSGVCKFACATKVAYDANDVVAQPGAVAGKLTQCPVSGVVFAVEASRPHVRLSNEVYVTCCDKCAEKLTADPRHYLRDGSTSVQLLSFDDCPNVVATRESLRAAMASAGIRATIEEIDLSSPKTSEQLRAWGSPTVLVNGRDVAGTEGPAGTACRLYKDDSGRMVGYPPASLLRSALTGGPMTAR
jgi:hypothetical protein